MCRYQGETFRSDLPYETKKTETSYPPSSEMESISDEGNTETSGVEYETVIETDAE